MVLIISDQYRRSGCRSTKSGIQGKRRLWSHHCNENGWSCKRWRCHFSVCPSMAVAYDILTIAFAALLLPRLLSFFSESENIFTISTDFHLNHSYQNCSDWEMSKASWSTCKTLPPRTPTSKKKWPRSSKKVNLAYVTGANKYKTS
jgi:hypothetical protein